MPLDLPTLFVVAACVTSLLGLFLLVLWLQDRSIRALAWWAAAYLIGAFAIGLWIAEPYLSGYWPVEGATALLFVACGMIWTGARVFHGREIQPLLLLLGAVIWLSVFQFSGVETVSGARVVLCSFIIASYAFVTALELKRERREPLRARMGRLVTPSLHAAIFLVPVLLASRYPTTADTFREGWFGFFALLTLIYVVGTAFIVVVLANAQRALMLKTAALTDPLTGIFNRRGFMEGAQKLIEQQAKAGGAISLLMFDLDYFKKINDRFGHAVGDDALRLFAQTASKNLRTNDLIGRLGGEEFAAILPGALEQAVLVAERLRVAFQAAGHDISGHKVAATVSIGAVCAPAAAAEFSVLLEQADAALYRAKSEGRNRVASALVSQTPRAIEVGAAEAPPMPVLSDFACTRLAGNAPANLQAAVG